VSSSDRADGTGTISADARLSLALDVDEYVSDAVTDASNPDDRSKADAALARAVAPWLVYDEKAISDVLDRHGTSKWENRDDESYRTSVLSHALDRRTDTTAYEKVPYWALRELALRDGLVDTSELVERESDDGSDTYLSFPDAEAYNRTLEHAREKYDLELDRSDVATDTRRGKPEAVLPEIEHEEIKTLGLVHGDGDVVRQAYDAVEETVRDAVTEYEWRGLVEAIPGLGKTRNVVKTAAETDENVTILTERHDLYDQVEEFAEKFGATVEVLPNFFDECPTANGTHGTEWARRIKELYRANATGADIHTFANPPCQEDGTCPYSTAWDRIDDDADIYVGNYVHAHVDIVGHSRTFVFDEFPGESFITKLSGEKMKAAVTAYVEETPLPFEDYTDVIEKRDTDDVEETVRGYFNRKEAFLTDTERAVYDDDFHAYAPAVVYGLVTAEDLGNGFEQASVNKEGITSVVHNRENTAVYVHTAPEFGKHTRGVVCLDGTPTHEMWETVLDTRLRHERVLETTEARKAYLREGMGYSVVQTTEYTKPYSSGRNVNVSKDTALLKSIRRKHGQEVDLITTLSARKKYPGDGREVDIDGVGAQKHHSAFKGSNDLEKSRLGAVVGSPHYGDSYIKKWGALMGEAVERNENKGKGLSYGETGNKILQHMREHETAQAVLRFNRDGRGGVVYVATSALPEWIPTEWKPDSKTKDVVRRTRSDAEREVMRLVTDEGAVPTRELSDAVDVGMRQVRNITQNLEDDGLVNRVRRGRGHEHEPTDKIRGAVKEASVALPDVDATPSTATSSTPASGDEVAQNPDALEEVSETDTASDVSTESETEANTETDMSEVSDDVGRRSVTIGEVEPQPQHHPDGLGRVDRDTSTDTMPTAPATESVSTDMPALFEVVEAQVEEVVVEPG
jgi:DNA-binding Lrp family transcriptional regulator